MHSAVASDLHFLLKPPQPIGMDRLVYICLCNALTDRKLKQVAAAGTGRRLVDVYEACGCRAQCGQCAKAILKLLREHTSQVTEPLPLAG